jgi:hypothetical protein
MIPPITNIVASKRPRRRASLGSAEDGRGSVVTEEGEVEAVLTVKTERAYRTHLGSEQHLPTQWISGTKIFPVRSCDFVDRVA